MPPEPGEDGYTVTGRTLKAKPGAEAEIPQGRNTRLSDDRKYLLAEQSGHLMFSGKSFHVKPVLVTASSLSVIYISMVTYAAEFQSVRSEISRWTAWLKVVLLRQAKI